MITLPPRLQGIFVEPVRLKGERLSHRRAAGHRDHRAAWRPTRWRVVAPSEGHATGPGSPRQPRRSWRTAVRLGRESDSLRARRRRWVNPVTTGSRRSLRHTVVHGSADGSLSLQCQ